MGGGILHGETFADHVIVNGHPRALASLEEESLSLKLLETVSLLC